MIFFLNFKRLLWLSFCLALDYAVYGGHTPTPPHAPTNYTPAFNCLVYGSFHRPSFRNDAFSETGSTSVLEGKSGFHLLISRWYAESAVDIQSSLPHVH